MLLEIGASYMWNTTAIKLHINISLLVKPSYRNSKKTYEFRMKEEVIFGNQFKLTGINTDDLLANRFQTDFRGPFIATLTVPKTR